MASLSLAREFEKLVQDHESRISAYVFGMHPNRADVEDILQETILALWEKFEEFDRERPKIAVLHLNPS